MMILNEFHDSEITSGNSSLLREKMFLKSLHSFGTMSSANGIRLGKCRDRWRITEQMFKRRAHAGMRKSYSVVIYLWNFFARSRATVHALTHTS